MKTGKIHYFQSANSRNAICGASDNMFLQRTNAESDITCSNCLRGLAKSKKLDTNAVFRDLVTLKKRFAANKDWRSVEIIQKTIKYMTELEGRLGIENLAALQERFLPVTIPKDFNEERWLRVCKVFADHLGLKPEDCKPEADIVDDLGADSLDTVEIVMGLEEEFSVDIHDHEAEKVTTLKAAYDLITYRLSGQDP